MFKPMLSGKIDFEELGELKFPVLASPKLDGIRCLIRDGKAITRTLKPIPNKYIQDKLAGLPEGLDGELVVLWTDFNGTQSAVMSEEGEPNFVYRIFDYVINPKEPFQNRLKNAGKVVKTHGKTKSLSMVPHTLIKTKSALLRSHLSYMSKGYEGTMIRNPKGPYKYGRSTRKEEFLLKLKNFHTSEAIITGLIERMHNANAQEINELGYTERSSAKAGLVPTNTLGALVVKDSKNREFEIGTGFTDEQRKEIWTNQKHYIGTTVSFKYQQLTRYNVPRFPVFLGFRSPLDISE